MWCGVFLCVLDIMQMFYAPATRFTVVSSYLSHLVIMIALMYSVWMHYKNTRDDVFNMLKRETEDWDKKIRDFPHRCTWTCDICGDERIDALIDVLKYQDESKTMQINIKYCRDNSECVTKAYRLDMWCGQKVYPLS